MSTTDVQGKGSVRILDIADRCNVSGVTVSRALRGVPSKVSSQTRKRILDTARELGYDPGFNHAARRLGFMRTGQRTINNVVALFFPSSMLEYAYYLPILRGLLEVLRDEKFGLLINYTNTPSPDEELLPAFSRGDVDGAVVLDVSKMFGPCVDRLRATPGFGERPLVSLISPIPGCLTVMADDLNGGYLAAQHLLSLGHRRILHFATQGNTKNPHFQRYLGYLKACAEFDVDPSTTLVAGRWKTGITMEGVHAAIDGAIDANPDVTAILAPSDVEALWIADKLHRLGMSIPKDVSLIGFDDAEELWNDRRENILTTVRLPLYQIGRTAASQIIEQVRAGQLDLSTISMPVDLIIRSSTAPPRAPEP